MSLFISYKSDERLRVAPIATTLQQQGYPVWWDPMLETGAKAYPRQIREALDSAYAVIVCWSPKAVLSDWVTGEAQIAKEAGKLIQVVIEGVSLNPPFNMLQYANLCNWGGNSADPEWAKVSAQVRKLAVGQSGLTSKVGAPAQTARDAAERGRDMLDSVTGYQWRSAYDELLDSLTEEVGRTSLEALADGGDARAQMLLGRAHGRGLLGIEKNQVAAVRLLRLAVDRGNAQAQCELGLMWEFGVGGLRRDKAEAIRFYRLAASQGVELAKGLLLRAQKS
ncbi:MAG: toll/interleukin-1 receptor domain-containing protein [Terricaulis sp.]